MTTLTKTLGIVLYPILRPLFILEPWIGPIHGNHRVANLVMGLVMPPICWVFRLFDCFGLTTSSLMALYVGGTCLFYTLLHEKGDAFFLRLYGSPLMEWLLVRGCRAEQLLYERDWRIQALSLLLSILVILFILDKIIAFHLLTFKLFFAPYLVLRNSVLEEHRKESSPYIRQLPAFRLAGEIYNSPFLGAGQLYLLTCLTLLLLGVEVVGIRVKVEFQSIDPHPCGSPPGPTELSRAIGDVFQQIAARRPFVFGCEMIGSVLGICPSSEQVFLELMNLLEALYQASPTLGG